MRLRFAPLLLACALPSAAHASAPLRLILMASEDAKKEGPKYEALGQYISSADPSLGSIEIRVAKSYPEAVRLFQSGEVDGMFSGSFVAAAFIGKGVAKPVARPLLATGVSTYKALIVAKSGTRPFAGISDFKGKRVAYTSLASAGEVFVHSLLPKGVRADAYYTPVPAATHQYALNAVLSDAADYAVVKNLVFDPQKYPGLAVVGSDDSENPNMTLILTTGAHARLGEKVLGALLKLERDASPQASQVKAAFAAKGFVETSVKDFAHTFQLIQRAGIDLARFDFAL